MEKSEMERKVREDEDFVNSPKHQNSLNRLLAKTDNPLENAAIGRLLLLSPEDVSRLYEESINELRKEMIDEEASQ